MSKYIFIKLFLFAALLLSSQLTVANDVMEGESGNDSKRTQVTVTKKRNVRFSILGGPGYTPDLGVLLGGSTLVSFHANGMDTFPQRSIIPMAFAASFGNGLGLSLAFRPQLFFNQDRFRVMGQLVVRSAPDNYYGVGFATNKARKRGSDNTYFRMNQVQFNPTVLFRLRESNFFVGPSADIIAENMGAPARLIQLDPHFLELGGTERGLSLFNAMVGVAASYDTRDIPANAYRGVYLDMKAYYSDQFWGSNQTFGLLNLDYRQYLDLSSGKGRVLSWMLASRNGFGDVPLTRLPLAGSPFDLRGYYMGQYRDKSVHVVMAEYRHKFHASRSSWWGRLANRFGFAVWGGSGFMGPSVTQIEGVMPNFGAGLRIELQPRMNFRLDVGYNPVEKQTLLYFNMTEAF